MRMLLAGTIVLLAATAAQADQAEGMIKAIDQDNLTITLADGTSYKLPGEFDMDALKEGMDVLLAYDVVDGEKLITDMQLPE